MRVLVTQDIDPAGLAILTRAGLKVDQVRADSPIQTFEDFLEAAKAEKLSMGNFHALPVVNRRRRLIGIVTSSDLIGELLKDLPV